MIKFVRFIKAADGVSDLSLDAYRREMLGPLIAGHQADLRLVRYVQTHRCPISRDTESAFLALRPGANNDFVGLEELWWEDEANALDVLVRKDGIFAKILLHQDRWINPRASLGWLAVDYPQIAPASGRPIAAPKSGVVRLTFAISPLESFDERRARRYWLTNHGPLIRSLAPARGALAYIQVHRQRDSAEESLRSAGLIAESPLMGHAEAWFSDAAHPAGADAQAAIRAAVEDERKFIDWSRSFVLVGKELVFVDRNW